MLVQLARLASVSIDNARSHARERDVAVALQQSLLPQVQPVEGLVIASTYLAAATDLGVGGDWYDVFELPHGLVALVVGDVVGHDVRASRTMGQLRHAIRAFASEDPAPVSVLSRLDVFLAGSSPEEFATVVYLLVDSVTGLVSVANAGHPPPLLLEPGELPRLFDPATAPPVGFLPPSAYQQQDFVLPVGGTLLVYTDGLVERRGFRARQRTGLARGRRRRVGARPRATARRPDRAAVHGRPRRRRGDASGARDRALVRHR